MSLIDSASLIVTPNAYKEGTLYSVIPSDGSGDLSVTRATTATRVNSAGLVELVPYNLLTYSEQFNNAAWIKSAGVTLTSGQTDFNGGNTAFRIQMSSASNFFANVFSAISGGVYTHSIYIKSNTGTSQNFRMVDGVRGVSGGVFNGTATTEWQRYQVTITTNSANAAFQLDNNSGAYATDLLICFAQSVEGSSALPYQKTETRLNIPRLDYSNGTCPSILVEPQRTNLTKYSSSFDNAAWINENCSETANALIAPDGTMSADYIVEDSTPSTQHRARQVISGSTNAIHTFSVYVKQGVGSRSAYIDAGPIYAYYNFSTGVVTAVNCVGSVENVGNGWYRFIITSNSAWTPTGIYVGLANGTSETYSGNGTSSIAFWGAQLEAGSYATSYIPTTSASVTRNADVISKTGISSLIGQTEGTLFVDVDVQSGYDANNLLATLSDGTTSNIIFINRVAGKAEYYIAVSGVGQATFAMPTILSNGSHKLAVAYKANDIVFYIDGVQVHSDTSASIPTCSRINIGSYVAGGLPYNDGIKATALWKTRLTNDELERLTGVGFNTYTEMANYYNYITQ